MPTREGLVVRKLMLRSISLATVACLVVASSAFAASRYLYHPVRVPWFSGGISFVLSADPTICPFDVQVDIPPTGEHAILFTNADGSGRYWVEGYTILRTTNLSTGMSLTWNASGPGGPTWDASGNTIAWVGDGPQVVWGSFLPLQAAGFYIYAGRVDYLAGAFSGHQSDVCAALAG